VARRRREKGAVLHYGKIKMREGWLTTLKRFVLWDYPRGSLHYDVMVALILAFIFLTPRHIFRDQPKAKNVVMLPGGSATTVFWIDPELLEGYTQADRAARVQSLIRSKAEGKRFRLTRVEPIFDSEQELKGYMALARPVK